MASAEEVDFGAKLEAMKAELDREKERVKELQTENETLKQRMEKLSVGHSATETGESKEDAIGAADDVGSAMSTKVSYPKGNHELCQSRCYPLASGKEGILFSGSTDRTIIKWDLVKKQVQKRSKQLEKAVSRLAYGPGRLASVGSLEKCIRIWDESTLELIHTLEDQLRSVNSIDFNQKADQLVSGCLDKSVRVWCVETGTCLTIWMRHDEIYQVRFLNDHTVLSMGKEYRKNGAKVDCFKIMRMLELEDIHKGMTTMEEESIRDPIRMNLEINSDASLIAHSAYCDRGLLICQWPEMSTIVRVMNPIPDSVAFHPIHPDILAVGQYEHDESYEMNTYHVKVYSISKGAFIADYDGHSDLIFSVCFTQDGSRLISTSEDQTTRVWDISELV